MSTVRPFYWSMRREIWGSPSLYFAPMAAAAIAFCGFLVTLARLARDFQNLPALDPVHQHQAITMPYNVASGFLMLVGMVVGGLYCVGAVHDELSDRSILFWKSLPVSDSTAVLAKASIPVVFLSVLIFAVSLTLQSVMLVVSTVVLWANGLSAATLWAQVSFPRMTLHLLYHMLTVHALCHAPFYAWLLFVSAWARRAVWVWAALPPFAIGVLERMVFGTSHFTNLLIERLSGGGNEAFAPPGIMPMDPMAHLTLGVFLLSGGLWIGLALTAAFLAGAIRLRHNRGLIN